MNKKNKKKIIDKKKINFYKKKIEKINYKKYK